MSIRELTDAECRRVTFGCNLYYTTSTTVSGHTTTTLHRIPCDPLSWDESEDEEDENEESLDMQHEDHDADQPDEGEEDGMDRVERINNMLSTLEITVKGDLDVGSLSDEILESLDDIVAAFNEISPDTDIVITSTNEPAIDPDTGEDRRSLDSRHYTNDAIDLRTRDMTADQATQICSSLASRLGDSYDVILESDHIHVEYDPDDTPDIECHREG